MSKLVADISTDKSISFTIANTEFLLRLLLTSQYEGKEIEAAYDALQKIKALHKRLLAHGQKVI